MITDLESLIKICEEELLDREYRPQYKAKLIKEWENLLLWMQENKLTEFDQTTGYDYCDETIGSHIIVKQMPTSQKIRLRAVRMLISYQETGDFEFRTPKVEHSFIGNTGEIIQLYLDHEYAKGLSDRTIDYKELYLSEFNQYLVEHELEFDDLTIDSIEDFFHSYCDKLATRHNCAEQLRLLFHYLYNEGWTTTDKALLVLRDNYRKESKIPTTYTEEEISRMISAVDRASSIGKRDYLVLLLASEYGWRAGDIVNFKFCQIDWDKNTISYAQNKTGNPVEYPLLSSVGNAIIDYLQSGRPKTDIPEVITSNHGKQLKAPTVHSIVCRYMREANIENWKEKKHGPHSLRHSLASNMLSKNISMPIISTVLGHQSTETTKVYLKVDMEKLSLCALPIPKLCTPLYKEVDGE